MKDATVRSKMEKAVSTGLKQMAFNELSDKDITKTIQAAFSFPTSGRVSRTRSVTGDKTWIRLNSKWHADFAN